MPSLTAASSPLKLRDLELNLSPLSDKDIEELDEWVQSRFLDRVRVSLKGASPEERRESLEIAMQQSVTLTWMSGLGAKILATVPGMARLVYQSALKRHPNITYEEIRARVVDPEDVERINYKFAKLNGMSATGGPTARPRRKAAKKRRR